MMSGGDWTLLPTPMLTFAGWLGWNVCGIDAPIRPVSAIWRISSVMSDAFAALSFKLSHDDLSKYNQVQRILYAGIIVVGILIVLSGLSMWKPVQLQYLVALFGGYDIARYVHFFCMASIVGFLAIHIVLALLVPKSLRAMIIGR